MRGIQYKVKATDTIGLVCFTYIRRSGTFKQYIYSKVGSATLAGG